MNDGDDSRHLSRRELLALFGTAATLAIIGIDGSTRLNRSGNGASAVERSWMSAPFEVGAGVWMGTLAARSDVPRRDGTTFIQTDAGSDDDQFAFYQYDGGWSKRGFDLTSVRAGTASVANINNEVHAAQFDGSGLASKVENARNWLEDNVGGQGVVRVTPRDDGSAHTWEKAVTFDTDDAPVNVLVDDAVDIDITVPGWPITVEDSSGIRGTRDVSIVGGKWTASGDPNGWLRLRDQTGYYVSPRGVDLGAGHTGTVIEVRNEDDFCELGVIDECRLRGGNGIDFVPASVTGGSGTQSFQGTTIRDVQINHLASGGFGIRPRGNFKYCEIRRPNIFPNGVGSTALLWDTDHGGTGAVGTVVTALQAETTSGVPGTTAVGSGDVYDGYYGALHVNPQSFGVANVTDGGKYAAIDYRANTVRIGSIGGPTVDIDVTDGSVSVEHTEYTAQDVRSLSPSRGWEAYHDGSGSNTEGPAFYDGDRWVSLVDGSPID